MTDITDRSRLLDAERDARAAAEAAQERLSFLVEAGEVLSHTLDGGASMEALSRLVVPRLADWCAVHLVNQDDDELRLVAVAHSDPERVRKVRELGVEVADDRQAGPARALATGEVQWIEQVTDEHLVQLAGTDERRLEFLRGLGLSSLMSVPLDSRSRSRGVLTLALEGGRSWTPEDVRVVREVARRASTALETAELFQETEQRARAAQVLAYIGDGVFMLDHDDTVLLWNESASAITGLPARTVVGKPVDEVIPGWSAIARRVPVTQLPGSGSTHVETLPLEVPGRELWLGIAGVGFPEGTVYAFRDLTEHHEVERMKADFVATVSHQLRTPLATVYGSAMTLQRDDLPLSEEDRGRLVVMIAEESHRLATIVNDILIASHIDSGRIKLYTEVFDAVELLHSIVRSTNTHVPASISLTLDLPDEEVRLIGDQDKIRQMVVNLLENAIKYSPDGGRVEVGARTDGDRVELWVRDEGLGIPRHEQQRIFEKFYRLDPNLTQGVSGTGLGLYICQELAERMGGEIRVTSEHGEGSTFTLDLPAGGADEPAVPAPSAASAPTPA